MSTLTASIVDGCPRPLLPEANYPSLGGDTNARFCVPIAAVGGTSCCLPCPKQHYVYPDNFQNLVHATTYVNVVGIGCCAFLLLSFAVLPVEYTRRHYLSVCLTFAILLMQMSFVIPLGNQKTQCFDKITPHDMYSSINCALSGAFLLGGGWSTVMWVFLRTLSLHLQICWQAVPGRRFFLTSQAAGWSIPVVFLAVALSVTGVSFRFGESCHINSKNGLQTFWGPLLAVAAASIVTQSITFGYCIQVYLRSLLEEKQTTELSSHLPYANSIRTVSAAQALRRVQRVVALQWRGIFVVIIILVDVVFFATVFLQFDGTTENTPENVRAGIEWLTCVLENGGDKNKCLDLASTLVVPEATALAVLFLLSFNGIWALILLGNYKIFTGWFHFVRDLFKRSKPSDEFVSYNARRVSEPDASYEMLDSIKNKTLSTAATDVTKTSSIIKSPEPLSLSMPREYNPSTFSAQLRTRADSDVYPPSVRLGSDSSFSSPPYTPFKDIASVGGGSPRVATGSPFSPYRDSPSLNIGNSQFSPYRDMRAETEATDYMSIYSQAPKYPPDAKIVGLAS